MDTVQGEMMAFYLEIASLENGGGWRSVGNAIGKSGAYARQLATGKRPVTKKVAAAWASKSGWVCKTVEVPACPDCGSVHHARCNGNAGTAVVLAPGETVRRPGQSKPRRRYCRLCLPSSLTTEQRRKVRVYALELASHAPAMEVT